MGLAEDAQRWPRNLRGFAMIEYVSHLLIEGAH